MKNIFTRNFVPTVQSLQVQERVRFIMRHFFRRKSSCQVAKDRLKILLISDRVNCSPEMMELIKADIAKVISKYMKIDAENMEIQINTKGSKSGRTAKPSLWANIPIVDVTMPEQKSQEIVKS